ncbi:hypothetical protein [uncultured Gimesia sp.]|uniref:hypothetical protein n=1 Tax=uncultured Gimesia sp. TaxID=1678688 RepID=UPI00262132AC|nr:hypothetical protein [uncultured Gimesia sp.]
MTSKRISAGLLSIFLLAMLGWTFIGNVGDVWTQVMLGMGVALGAIYAFYGQLPEWLINLSGGKIVADDDPGNISPRVYLPILGVAILVAAFVFLTSIFLF